MSKQYLSFPKVNLSFPTANISYCVVSYKGNTTATSGNVISGNISTGKYTSGDLSFNTLYTFTLTPYSSLGLAGISKKVTVDTTPQVSGAKSSVKSTYDAATLQWSGTTYDNYTVSRSINSSSLYSDISTNIKTNYYYDNDLSGNTVYYYYVKPYDATGNSYQPATELSIYTNVRAPTDLSYTFLDSSGVSLKWTTKNSYNTSYYNAAYVVSSTGSIVSISGDIQNATVTGLTRNTAYTCYAQTYLVSIGNTFTATTATPYIGGNILLYNVSMNSISVSWSGTYFDRVAVYRRVGTLQSYTTLSGDDYASPYVDSDISGNTTYYYYVTPKTGVFTGSASSVVYSTTPVAYPTDVSASFYDSSAIQLSFTAPKNSYSTSILYSAIASNTTYGNTTVTGTSPILIQNLSMGTAYTCYIKVTLDNVYNGISSGLSIVTPSPYAIDLLLVGGGGGGGNGTSGTVCGGGGAGGVVYGKSFPLTPGSTYTIVVGSGGAATSGVNSEYPVGGNTYISSSSLLTTIIARGGANGSANGLVNGYSGGCGGGVVYGASGGLSIQPSYTSYYSSLVSYGNAGGDYSNAGNKGSGGGGAGGVGGSVYATDVSAGYGGPGILINITGTPTYYAGGGGGASYANRTYGGLGGSGGGGNGPVNNLSATSGTANTGGGGGGSAYATGGATGSGGSGVAIIRVPTTYLGTYSGSPTLTTDGTYTVLKYTSGGTYTCYSSSPLHYSNGSSLSAWTLSSGATITVSSTVGNPSSSFSLPNGGYSMYINLSSVLSSFLNTTIIYDHYVNYPTNTGCPDVIYGSTSTGANGLATRVDTRNNPATVQYFNGTTNATEFSIPTGSALFSANAFTYTAAWYTHKIQTLTDGTVKFYINNTLYLTGTLAKTYFSGTYLSIRADGGGGPNYFDNIYVYNGIV